jgi:uncharacterized protein YjbI with pentapeptide repeats
LLFGTDFTGANLANANFKGSKLIGADLSGADLRGADLSGAVLVVPLPPGAGAGFSYDALTGDELINSINQAGLESIYYDDNMRKLTEARLKPIIRDTLLKGALYNQDTRWPLGFEIPTTAVFRQ